MLIGAELHALTPGQCELQLPVTERIGQQHGFVHGGVLSYLADNALTYAGGTALLQPVVTSEFKINYLRPAVGQRLVARAHAAAHRPLAGGVPLRRVGGEGRRRKALRCGAGHDCRAGQGGANGGCVNSHKFIATNDHCMRTIAIFH